ncbi:hypothetical protein [Celeribacter persicus]|uniref:Uncharacterized protein n=1 Tax=Celeribacter persicus TaxID=1651082 RepID=A0A2T5HAM8_9RHOB|nr:hypothetical protein [Celeribacter persicus]PTQ68592.1 hypothetical protein C8N42_11468 [Celeribacter persicus]
MALDKFVLIVVAVLATVGITFWLLTLLAATLQLAFGWLLLIPAGIAGYVVWRVIEDRLRNAEDDHYDKIEK